MNSVIISISKNPFMCIGMSIILAARNIVSTSSNMYTVSAANSTFHGTIIFCCGLVLNNFKNNITVIATSTKL